MDLDPRSFIDHGGGAYSLTYKDRLVRVEPTTGGLCPHCGKFIWHTHRCSGGTDDLRMLLEYMGRSWLPADVKAAYDRLSEGSV